MHWVWFNALIILSPFVLLWGWIQYIKLPTHSDWRSRASLVGLAAPLLSLAVWGMMAVVASINSLNTSSATTERMISVGVWIPLLGMLVSLAGRPRLIPATVPTCIATVFFWIGTTLP
ncbi:MAG TPA: hypothetical protein VK699_01935 [Terriglobales bacterium]|jgi:hypothetical protein|nr:hypothetical protein [Terriglobales bacterium]